MRRLRVASVLHASVEINISAIVEKLFGAVRLSDVVDVALLAAFIFIVLLWVRDNISSAASRRTLLVSFSVVVVYQASRIFDLFLTKNLIEVLFVALLVAAVVVFQSDLRRMVDRIGSWRWKAAMRPPPIAVDAIPDILASTAMRLAEMKRGALIAVAGREPWDRHLKGGVELNGTISKPLLISLFNPSSPGHDGAVLIKNGRILRFAVHLPLSARMPEVSRWGGTRHAAALGLAEACDALVIVASEERGVVSVARNGTMREMESAADLKMALDDFWATHYDPSPERQRQRRWRNLRIAALSVFSAMLVWLLFAYRPDTVQRTYSVPIEFRGLPAGWVLEDPEPAAVQVTLSGTEQDFRLLDPQGMVASLEVEAVEEGVNTFLVTAQNLSLPGRLILYHVEPNAVAVEAHPVVEARAPVMVKLNGSLPDSLQIDRMVIDPDSVTLLVPVADKAHPPPVSTLPIDLGQVGGTRTFRVELVVPSGVRLTAEQQSRAAVRLEIGPHE